VEGTPFGRYRLVEVVGRGGMGEVWKAFDTAMNRIVALKVLPVNFADDDQYQVRFRREAEAAAGLDEPHVVPIHDFGEIDGRLYVTMRLIDGKTVHELLANGPLAPQRAVWIIEQIAAALNAAHRVGLVHRDVKPSNILVTEDDFAYLIDFGIARAAGATKLTSTGATIGTLAYMAPERFNSDRADARADIYALTCVLHECLTGSQPFPGDSLERQIASHLAMPPPQPSTMQPGVPPQMDQVIATGMAKNPDQRYATTKDLAAAARAAIATPSPHDQPAPPIGVAPSTPSWSAPLRYPDTSPNAPAAGVPTQHRTPAEPAPWPPIPVPVPDSQPAQLGRQWWRGPAILTLAGLLAVVVIAVIVATVLLLGGHDETSNDQVIASTSARVQSSAPSATPSEPVTNSSAPVTSSTAAPVPTQSSPKGPAPLFAADGLSDLLANMRKRFGDTMGYRLVVNPYDATLQRADPANARVKQNYRYSGGEWTKWASDETTTPSDSLVDLGAFNVAAVAATLAGSAPALGTPDSAQSFLTVKSDSGALRLQINSLAPGANFMVINADGSVKGVHPP
jgi:serine/threonine-protein kinase